MNKVLSRVDPLLTTKWLAARVLGKSLAPNSALRVLDSTSLPGAEDVFDQGHIPGAQFFDIDECSDANSPYPRMLPKPRLFEDYVGNLGISNKTHVVVYDMTAGGLFSAPRVWWMLRYFGHDSVSLLKGGLPKWVQDGLEITAEHQPVAPEIFKAQPNTKLLTVFEDVEKLAKENCKSRPVVDVRNPAGFASHIRGATNVPLGLLTDPDTRQVRSPEELSEIFSQQGLDISKPYTSSCLTGVTACAGAFAGYLCGNENASVYDGAWMEWQQRAPPELSTHGQ